MPGIMNMSGFWRLCLHSNLNIIIFPKILSSSHSTTHELTNQVILDSKFRFTCSELNLYYDTVKVAKYYNQDSTWF